ncbi:MAG: histidine phosphatase family protein [Candidatus Latescibacteria bacterium]|jgi:broad specificity phosphatase PhoE|nr:histidine phosphatase family protein [Candidatus Latescibacterota bacterium]
MNHLILIKHAMPQIDETKLSSNWQLSDPGRASCKPLAHALKSYKPDLFITSEEPKARETGQAAAKHLQIPCSSAPNLHEHDRKGFAFEHDREIWHNTVQTFFNRPNDLIFGSETANQARDRFARAVENAVQKYPQQTIAIAAHGTVISLLVAHQTQTDGFDLWKKLNLPSFVVLDLPDCKLNTLVTQIG